MVVNPLRNLVVSLAKLRAEVAAGSEDGICADESGLSVAPQRIHL